MSLTPNLNLHIYDKDSKPTYLVDHNNDMTSIDQGYAALKLSTDTASSNVAGLTTQVNTVQQLAESASALATQANENSSHASADASAAVAAANNANTEAAKAVAATEQLVNISDIEFTPSSGWSLDGDVVCAVVNGVFSFSAAFTSNSEISFTGDFNYNINCPMVRRVTGSNVDNTSVVAVINGHLTFAGTGNGVRLYSCFSWNPAWTKKTNS